MARKRKKSHAKHSRRKARGVSGFKFSTGAVMEAAALGAGAVAGQMAISKLPFPSTLFGIDTAKFSGLKAVATGVVLKMVAPKNKEAHLAAQGAIAVGVAETVKGLGIIKGVAGYNPLQGTDYEAIEGYYDNAEGSENSPLQGTEEVEALEFQS